MTTHSTWQTTVSFPAVFTLTTHFNHDYTHSTWQTTISCPALHKAILIHTTDFNHDSTQQITLSCLALRKALLMHTTDFNHDYIQYMADHHQLPCLLQCSLNAHHRLQPRIQTVHGRLPSSALPFTRHVFTCVQENGRTCKISPDSRRTLK